MCKTKHNSKDYNWCFFIVSEIDIIWSSQAMHEFVTYQLWTGNKTFFSLRYLFQFFLTGGWLRFLQEYY